MQENHFTTKLYTRLLSQFYHQSHKAHSKTDLTVIGEPQDYGTWE